MRGFSKVLSSGLLFFLLCLPVLFALEVPKRADGYVTDHARLLSLSAKANLEALLKSFEDQTSNQVIVATFPSLEGNSLEDFSMRLAEAWKVGQKGKDNGVIFLIFKNDRKIRIEVGYGLEGVLTDATSGQIINQVVAPYFRKEDYQSGIVAGVDAIMKATQGEFKGSDKRDHTNLKLLFLFLTFILTHWILRLLSSGTGTGGRRFGGGTGFYTGGYWGGGGSSGGGGFSGGGGSFGGGGASGRW